MDEPSQAELEAAHCWEDGDRVPGRPETTAFRRTVRLHQARWRERHGHPIGTHPIVPKGAVREVGSRLPLDYARDTGANFVTHGARAAARARSSTVEPRQTFDHQRLWADLLWAPTMAFNLFGDLAADPDRADRAVHTWWPDTPGHVVDVRFAHSPGRWDPEYTANLRTFDAAFVLDLGDGTHGIVGVGTRYHDWLKPEIPRPDNLARYLEVAERSHAFAGGALDGVGRRWALTEVWLEHLLLLSMLQHPSRAWTWGRTVVVHPAGNLDVASGCANYLGLLADRSSFTTLTLEGLLDSRALPQATEDALRERYDLRTPAVSGGGGASPRRRPSR